MRELADCYESLIKSLAPGAALKRQLDYDHFFLLVRLGDYKLMRNVRCAPRARTRAATKLRRRAGGAVCRLLSPE